MDSNRNINQLITLVLTLLTALVGGTALVSVVIVGGLNGNNIAVIFGSNNTVQQTTTINNLSPPPAESPTPHEPTEEINKNETLEVSVEANDSESEATEENCTCPEETLDEPEIDEQEQTDKPKV